MTPIGKMNDINGTPLALGDIVKTQQGTGSIMQYLAPEQGRMGALVRLLTTDKKMVDLRLLLSGAVVIFSPEQEKVARTTGARFGV